MLLRSLKGKLLFAVSGLVIGSGLLISLLVSQRYSNSLFETMTAQAENLAHAIALEGTDKILTNDLVSLQKMLDQQVLSNTAISYLFVLRGEEVLAHTFSKGIPIGLLTANSDASVDHSRSLEIVSTTGEHYLDIAWPIFDGKAGVLRLGFSERPYNKRVRNLWLQMSLLTLGILLLAVAGTLVFVRQITRPLMALAHATQRIDHGEVGVRVSVRGQDEVGRLAASFNSMVVRIEESTQRLEEKGVELERANQQTSTFCSVVREIGALRNLNELGAYLVEKIQDILRCGPHMVLFFLTQNRASLFVLSQNDITLLDDPDATRAAIALLTGLKKATFIERIPIHLPLIDRSFQEADRCAVAPLEHEDQVFGALAVACPKMCECDAKGLDTVCLILNQAAGVIKRAVLHEEETRDIQRRLEISSEFSGIVGKDPKMQAVYKLIDDISATDATVLIQGESGTGKEVVARAIQQRSLRKDKPFVVIDCSAYPATLLESELFGHEKGAFTGATRQKAGRFEQADGGTVFLDEIGEISPSAQIKFLRVLQSQRFERLGGEKILAVNVRILAATNKDLIQEVKSGRFREDLFYRLNVIPIHLPPLRERRNDIPTLVRHFLGRFAVEQKKSVQELSPEAMRILLDYPWPGNVRELENSIEHAVVLAKAGRIEAADLPSLIVRAAGNLSAEGIPQIGRIAKREQELLRETLEECSWNKKEAARRLGISRSTLYDKLKKYQLARRATH